MLCVMLFAFNATACQKVPQVDPNTEYTVTFDSQGGEEIEAVKVLVNNLVEQPDNPRKEGHQFQGWALQDGTPYTFEEPVTSDLTLYAQWKIRSFTVSFQDPEGAPYAQAQTCDWGTQASEPDTANVQKEGYALKWYNLSSNAIWNFATDKVVSNTTLVYRYVTTKDSYTAADIATDFYPVQDRQNYGPENTGMVYEGEEGESVKYYYSSSALQQVVVNLELATADYSSVTIKAKPYNFKNWDWENGAYTDTVEGERDGGVFARWRAYIVTDLGGSVQWNDQATSGYNPAYYHADSTNLNADLFTITTDEDGWQVVTFDLMSLNFWAKGTTCYAFAWGWVNNNLGIEIDSITFNPVDKNAEYTATFVNTIGQPIEGIDAQTVKYNSLLTKPEKLADTESYKYTGEWVGVVDGEVFDFENTRVRGDIALMPERVIIADSWTGTAVARDFYNMYSALPTNPAVEVVNGAGNAVYVYYNGVTASGLQQIIIDELELSPADYRYYTITLRNVDPSSYEYKGTSGVTRARMYVYSDLGGSVSANNLSDKDSYYYDFNAVDLTKVTSPIDVSAPDAEGYVTVTVDLRATKDDGSYYFPYFVNATTLKGIGFGMLSSSMASEVKSVALLSELPANDGYTVTFVDEAGNAIEGIEAQTVPAGKVAAQPDNSLVPEKPGYEFGRWVDAEGNTFSFATQVAADVTLKPYYVESQLFTGTTVTLTGQQIVDSFIASHEHYGKTLTKLAKLTLDTNGNAVAKYGTYDANGVAAANANKAVSGLDLGIRIHEGSTVTFTFTAKTLVDATHFFTRFKASISFRGQDPATALVGGTSKNYFKYEPKTAANGVTSGGNDYISYTVNGTTMTVTLDLWAMRTYIGAFEDESINNNYVEGISLLLCQDVVGSGKGGGATKNAEELTFTSITFNDVLQSKQA